MLHPEQAAAVFRRICRNDFRSSSLRSGLQHLAALSDECRDVRVQTSPLVQWPVPRNRSKNCREQPSSWEVREFLDKDDAQYDAAIGMEALDEDDN
jgi:hypothetical protein